MGRVKEYRLVILLLCGVMAYGALGNRADAVGFYENPYIVMAPDGQAWGIPEALPSPADASNLVDPPHWYPRGEEFITGMESGLPQPGEGEHYYQYDREGLVPIAKWQVVHRPAKCIHPDFPFFHGKRYDGPTCGSSYYSGWRAWCADCGGELTGGQIYMSREKIHTLKEIDVSLDYYYDCPTCGHLEQGCGLGHECTAVSANRYRVVYHANAGDAMGYMQSSFHMYDNADTFEGIPVTPAVSLSRNCFRRIGFIFTGWNTDPQGGGDFYEDGQEIRNLTAENYDPESGKGTVVLYAQWKKVSGTLFVDPGKGWYRGKAGLSSLPVKYGEEMRGLSDDIKPPMGPLVQFETFGGNTIQPIRGSSHFSGWRLEQPAQGLLQDEVYQYLGEDGGQDRISALYQEEGIRLPLPVRQGYSFGGWYRDPQCEVQAGNAGDLFITQEDVILYACWVELVLDAKVNLRDHSGKGAVDLQWFQPDGNKKLYLLYQKREGEEYTRIYDAGDGEESFEAVDCVYAGKEENYQIPASGFYELEAFGAQGQAFESFEGGMGGSAGGRFYLEKGDLLTIRVGGQGGYGKGGDGQEYGNGGGRTEIASRKLGTLLIAGGGGGASPGGNGGAGGLENGLWKDGGGAGQSGNGGGGGGFLGGIAGERQVHIHDDACLHHHLGDGKSGGECYVLEKVEKECVVRVSGLTRDSRRADCARCLAADGNAHGSMRLYCWALFHEGCGQGPDYGSNGWWVCERCGCKGYSYGSGSSEPKASKHSYFQSAYVLNCERVYDCDGDAADILLPAYGGSSYINKELASHYEQEAGVKEGDGFACIRPINIGFQDRMELIGVAAEDRRAPGKIEETSIHKEAEGGGKIKIMFSAPEDEGTLYYHQAKSYPAGSEQMLSESNVTCTEVVTGVTGYYYRIDDREHGVLTAENADNRENPLTEPALVIRLSERAVYLHIAAVDRAGNVGESLTIRIAQDDSEIAWKLSTSQMEASGLWEETDYGSVLPSSEKKYYVRADGRTPFLLKYTGEMDGMPRADYQIDRAVFTYLPFDYGAEGSYTILFPGGNFAEREETNAGQWGRIVTGKNLLQASMYGKGLRTEKGRKLEICQSFTLDRKYHGQSLALTPTIGAAHGDSIVLSNRAEDAEHGITLIGDGEPPEIYGLERMDEQLIDREEGEECTLDLWAEDDLSGVKSFYATLLNLDNYGEITYYPEEDGHIRICLSEDSPMFSGDLNLTVCARDGVGNETVLEKGATEFGLRAKVVRMLPPHTPEFKRGETGVLQVTVWGYADRLEIQFPEEFASEDPSLNRVFEYAVPSEEQEEEITFMTPLYLRDSREYFITVKAFKGDRLLEQHPVLCALRVNDTVLGELRTRLR